MRAIALIDAAGQLQELCETVQRTGESVQITSEGRPVAVIAPWRQPSNGQSIWEARREFERQYGPLEDDFDLPERTLDERTRKNPLD